MTDVLVVFLLISNSETEIWSVLATVTFENDDVTWRRAAIMKSFFHDNANDDTNKNEKFQQTSTGQSFESYVQKFRVSIQLFPTAAGLNYQKW